MLTSLHVRDFAIIDEVELDLAGGMTVLTGETGAGKSILLDALGLVLGDRADGSAVRHGAERAEITASMDTSELAAVREWLEEHDLDADGECVVRRVVGREGRSRAYINGASTTLQTLRQLGERLIDIHGQHAHQSLVRPAVQREILDDHGGHKAAVAAVAEAWQQWRDAVRTRQHLEAARRDRDDRLDLLRYQAGELDALDLAPGEAAELEQEHSRLANVGRLAEGCAEALALIYESESGSAHDRLGKAVRLLDGLAGIDPALAEVVSVATEAQIQAAEAAAGLQSYASSLDADPVRADTVAARRQSVRELARKHQVSADELPERLAELKAEIGELENAETALEAATDTESQARKTYDKAAETLSRRRKSAAKALAGEISGLMAQLGMPGGRMEIRVTTDTGAEPQAAGRDAIEFLVTANPGQPPASLGKVASGGELSRIGLAIQVAATRTAGTPSVVFDEVDAGVGGGVAEIVGRRLRELGARRQVLCVTHLPQVASQADAHLRVSKLTDGETTRTRLARLTETERIEELARMLGGVDITDRTRAHAEEMITRAREA